MVFPGVIFISSNVSAYGIKDARTPTCDGNTGLVMHPTQFIPRPQEIASPKCATCGAQMWLASIEPDMPDHDRRTFECPRCLDEHVAVVKYR
jgi:hypothetical protein